MREARARQLRVLDNSTPGDCGASGLTRLRTFRMYALNIKKKRRSLCGTGAHCFDQLRHGHRAACAGRFGAIGHVGRSHRPTTAAIERDGKIGGASH
jgi:hypothetical protein